MCMCRCEYDWAIRVKNSDEFWTYYGCPPENINRKELPVLDCCKNQKGQGDD